MPKFVIMGSHPGDGDVVDANSHKEAFATFVANDSGLKIKEVMDEISNSNFPWEKNAIQSEDNDRKWIFGDYEIMEFGQTE